MTDFAVAVLQGEYAVGHIPRESSRVAWYFLRHGGEIITGRLRRSDVDSKGLGVPCVYTFLGEPGKCLNYTVNMGLISSR